MVDLQGSQNSSISVYEDTLPQIFLLRMPISDSAQDGDQQPEVIEPSGIFSSSDDEEETFTSGDDDVQWSYSVNSLNTFNMQPKDGDYSQFKRRLECDLRVGSAYHLGTRNRLSRFSSEPYPVGDYITETECTNTCSDTSPAFLRHPFNLVMAREQGLVGPASKSRRLAYRASRWLVEGRPRFDGLQMFGNRSLGASNTDPQKFPELIQGSLWAVSRLHLENTFKCHRGCVNALSFNGNGNLIASGSDDLKVVITNWITKEQVAKYNTRHWMNIFHVKFVPETNDTQIVSCACDSEVRLAQLASDGSLVGSTRLLVSHQRACHKLALPQGEPHIVLSAGADGKVFSIDLRESKAHNILWLPSSEFFSISSNPIKPHEFAVCGRSEAIIRVYDRRKMDSRNPLSGYLHCYGAQHLRPSNRSSTILTQNNSASAVTLYDEDDDDDDDEEEEDGDGTERIGNDLRDDDDEDEEEPDEDFFSSFSAHIGRRVRAVLSGLRGRARIALQVQGSQSDQTMGDNQPHGLEKSKFSCTAAVYSNQGDAILASYNDDDIYLFDVRNPSAPYLHKYSGHRNMQTIVSATFFGPNSEYIVSGSDDGFFYIWDRESEGIVQWLHADADGAVNVIESHPTLPVLASAGLDFDFKVWTPLHPLTEQDDYSHLKYTFSKVPPDILRLRRSRLAQALFAEPGTRSTNRSSGNRIVMEQVVSAQNESVRNKDNQIAENTTDLHSSESKIESEHSSSNNLGEFKATIIPEPSSSATPQRQTFRKRRRCHSSTSDVPDGRDTTDSELEVRMEVHSDGEQSNSPSSRAISHRHSRKHRRCQRLNPATEGNEGLQNISNAETTTGMDVVERVPPTHVNSSHTDQYVQPRLPQHLLPFNRKDLALRVAQNWVNRTCELRQMDGLDEANSQILSALETVAQLHARETHRENNSADSEESNDTDGSTDDSGIMGSFLLIRRPNCQVERSEETLATRDRVDQPASDSNSLSDSGSWTPYSATHGTEMSQTSEDSIQCQTSSTNSTTSSDSASTTVASSSPTLSFVASNDSEILQLLNGNGTDSVVSSSAVVDKSTDPSQVNPANQD